MSRTRNSSDSRPDVHRLVALLICVVTMVACLAYSSVRDTLPDWWRGHGGGIPYVLFWIAFGFLVVPYRRFVVAVCLVAVVSACLLEVLQLWHPDWLTTIRSTRFGAALLGSSFHWSDFLPYFIGGALGYVMLIVACRTSPPTAHE